MLSKGLLPLAAREAFAKPALERKPETSGAVDLTDDDLMHTEEAANRALQGIHHFNALATSRLVPENGLVLDLGSGSGGFAFYLAQRRPDLQIICVDPSERLVHLGQEQIIDLGLGERMNFNIGKIDEFSQRIPARIDMITSVLSMHSVAHKDDMFRCFQEMQLVRIRCGCAIWIFDWVRPNLLKTAENFPPTLMPGTPIPFRRQCRNSLMASFTFAEMSDALSKVSFGTIHHAQAKNFKIYQTHWLEREDGLTTKDELWKEGRIPAFAVKQFNDITAMLPTVPLPKHLK